MKFFLAFVIALLPVLPLAAQDSPDSPAPAEDSLFLPGESFDLDEFLWIKRPIVVFADNENDPRFVQQMALLHDRRDALVSRDVVVLTDTTPAAKSALRKALRPRGFMLVLIGKDGNVYLRKPFPWNEREISRSIDKLPMRQQEVEDRRSVSE